MHTSTNQAPTLRCMAPYVALALLYRFEHDLELYVCLKAFLKAA